MKRVLCTIIVLVCSTFSVIAFAEEGKCGENLKWSFDSATGKLIISGTGPMYDFALSESDKDKPQIPWKSLREKIKSIVIYNGVTSIGVWAFYETSATSVIIPESMIKISSRAFNGCYYLTSVSIPAKVSDLYHSAFNSCYSLQKITIDPANPHYCSINGIVYSKDKSTLIIFPPGKPLSTYTVPKGVKKIGSSAFEGCSKLSSITLPHTLESIGSAAFKECKELTSIVIPEGIKEIGWDVFNNCSKLSAVTLPHTLESIGYSAFNDCKELTSIIIPKGVKKIGKYAFSRCSKLSSVILNDSLEYIENMAFYSCKELESINIPEGVKKVEYGAFCYCSKLTLVILPGSVIEVGKDAFEHCDSLTIYTASSADFSSSGIPYNRIVKLTPFQLSFYYPFSMFAKGYVEEKINQWQQRGEFERTPEWRQRVNEQTRQQKIQSVLSEAEQEYIAFHVKELDINLQLGKYDADNEVFSVKDDTYGVAYIAVPYEEAREFKATWSQKTVNYAMQIQDDAIKLASLMVKMPNGKEYSYRNTDAVNYNLAEAEYQFDPIDLDFTNSPIKQEQQNTTNTPKIGRSKIDTDIPVTEASTPNTFVIIIANENYKNVASVPFAKNDGAVFQKYCQKTLGVPVSNIHYVENATYNDIRIQLAWLNDVCEAYEGNASLIIYYTGHGMPDDASKSAYLLPVDGDGRYVASAYKMDDFYEKLGAMKAKSIVVLLDACFSGATRDGNMVAQAKGIALKVKNGVPLGNTVAFAAAQEDETAGFNEQEGHGMFTYYLLKKLQETKGNVTLQELGNYISTNVRQQSVVMNGKPQTPCVTPSAAVATEWQTWTLK